MKFLTLALFLFAFAGISNDCASVKNRKNSAVSNTSQTVESTPDVTPTPEKLFDKSNRQVKSGDFDISWSKENIIAKNISSGKTAFSARDFALRRLKNEFKENFGKNGEPYFEDFTFRYQIISIAGNLLSLDEKTSYSPQSYTKETFLTVDLTKPQQIVALTDFFSEKKILDALVSNKIIAENLKNKNLEKPTTFAEFRSNFNKTVNEAIEVSDDQLDKCWFPENVLKFFAFETVNGDQLTVDLAIPCRADMREDDVYLLKLVLPMPEKLTSDLSAATNKKLLFDDFKNSLSNDETIITFEADSLK